MSEGSQRKLHAPHCGAATLMGAPDAVFASGSCCCSSGFMPLLLVVLPFIFRLTPPPTSPCPPCSSLCAPCVTPSFLLSYLHSGTPGSTNPKPSLSRLLLFSHAAPHPRPRRLETHLPPRRPRLHLVLHSLPALRRSQRPALPLPRFRQSHDPRSRPSALRHHRRWRRRRLRPHPHGPRRHALRTHRPVRLRHLLFLSAPGLRRRFQLILVL